MATINPTLRFHYYRDDGDGGVEIVVTTAEGKTQQLKLNDMEVARHLEFLSSYVVRRYRAKFGDTT